MHCPGFRDNGATRQPLDSHPTAADRREPRVRAHPERPGPPPAQDDRPRPRRVAPRRNAARAAVRPRLRRRIRPGRATSSPTSSPKGTSLPGIGAFSFAMFAICWAWINFSWFASAYDTDDWFYRVSTMVQMIGVIVLALGLPAMFASVDARHVLRQRRDGGRLCRDARGDGRAVAARRASRTRPAAGGAHLRGVRDGRADRLGGARVLRTSRSARSCHRRRAVRRRAGRPVRRRGETGGTPWHAQPHRRALRPADDHRPRRGLFGTVTAVGALVDEQGWSAEAALVVVAGVGLTFGLWWIVLHHSVGPHPRRTATGAPSSGATATSCSSRAIAATGAGLHVAAVRASRARPRSARSARSLSIAVPVLVFSAALFLLYTYLIHERSTRSTSGCSPARSDARRGRLASGGRGARSGWPGARHPVAGRRGGRLRVPLGHRHQAAALERALRG